MDHSPASAVLVSPVGLDAVAAGDSGTVIRLARRALGWSQQRLAEHAGYSQATISRLERSKSRAAQDTVVLADLAEALGIPPAALGVASKSAGPTTLADVDRREFLAGAVTLAVTAMLPHGVAIAGPGRIDATDAAQCRTALRRLFEMDDAQGGGSVYHLAAGMAQRLQDALRRGTYPGAVGHELYEVTAATMEHAGWLAYDAGRAETARRWWLETCHLADLADVPDARVTALASMALQASTDPMRGPDTVDLARAARAAAKDQHTPTLLSLLAAREAVGHARSGDRVAAASAIAEARRWLDHGRRGDEPLWLGFWGAADLAWHETQAAAATGRTTLAETAARAALANVDAEAFPRNHALYAVRLGLVLTQVGQLDEAVSVTGYAFQRVDAVRGSRRIVSDLRRTVDLLGAQSYSPARTFADAARHLLPTA